MKAQENPVTLFWFRRDLRLIDNAGLYQALKQSPNVLPVFIFDPHILSSLSADDHRVSFIWNQLNELKKQLRSLNSDLLIAYETPLNFYKKMVRQYNIQAIYTNRDYEPYAVARDRQISRFCEEHNIDFQAFKDHVIFEKSEILNGSKKPYTVFTPYKNKWLSQVNKNSFKPFNTRPFYKNFFKFKAPSLSLKKTGFSPSKLKPLDFRFSPDQIKNYHKTRNLLSLSTGTSHVGLHLRFGTVSIRKMAHLGQKYSATWLSELIWRDFYAQILWHFPETSEQSFKIKYENVPWRNDPKDFKRWAQGMTGYPLVDAGMRELNSTGYMHNRARMIVASFLTKHLLQHWKKGERYFAEKLYDYDLSSNVGNWQWAASTGCDAVPYFRIFNPEAQQEKFDPELIYIKKWIPEFGTKKYPRPMIENNKARNRALKAFKSVI